MRQRDLFIQHAHIEAAASDLTEYEVHIFVCLSLVGGIQELQLRIFLRKQDLCKFADHRLPLRIDIIHPKLLQGKIGLPLAQAFEQAGRPRGAAPDDHRFIFFHTQVPFRSAFACSA